MSSRSIPVAAYVAACAAALFALAPTAKANGLACITPYQYTANVTIAANSTGQVLDIPAPAGYRVQIEYATASLRVASGGRANLALGTTANGTFSWHTLGPVVDGFFPIDRLFSQQVQFYADPGSFIKVEFDRTPATATAATGTLSLSGCMVSL